MDAQPHAELTRHALPQALPTLRGALLRDAHGQMPAGLVRAAGRDTEVSVWSRAGAQQGRLGGRVLLPMEQLRQDKC